MYFRFLAPLALLFILLPTTLSYGFRQKRFSDQRLAELETFVGLTNGIKGRLKTIPYAFGSIDPEKLGRRRRSPSTLLERLLNNIERENRPVPWPWIVESQDME